MDINNVIVVGTGLVGSLMGTNYVVVPYKSDVFVEDLSSGNITPTNIRLVVLVIIWTWILAKWKEEMVSTFVLDN
jgi:hypothetical protein